MGLRARIQRKLALSYGQKVFLLATIPLILAMAILGIMVTREARADIGKGNRGA